MARNLSTRKATVADAEWLVPRLRKRDLEEATAAVGADQLTRLGEGVRASGELVWTAYDPVHGRAARPVFLLGCAPVGDGVGAIWLLGTDEADRYPTALTRITKQGIVTMLKTYRALINYADARNESCIRWLTRIGFTVEPAAPFGFEGRMFHRFTMEA